jgi:heavy metal efflux system protein
MIENIIGFALRNRLVIIIFTLIIVGLGINAFRTLPIDAFPDVTNVQVQVISEAPGRSPLEVERFATRPIEVALSGLPRLHELRSLSKFGLSLITVVFEDGVDIYFARQLVLERLIEAKETLPEGIETSLGPMTTGLGEIYQYTLEMSTDSASVRESRDRLMDLRTMQDWIVRPLLKTIPGVADVSAFGGYVKQYQIVVDPDKLFKYNLSLHEVFEAVAKNNANAGGGILAHVSEQYLVRSVGLIRTLDDVGTIVVAEHEGVPVYIQDVADVAIGPEVRQGAIVKDGNAEGVAGIVMMMRGGSGRDVAARVKEKVEEINNQGILPAGTTIQPFYDRTDLVQAAVSTVTKALEEGIVLVVIVLYLFLRSVRGALVVALTLPLAALSTFIAMKGVDLSANLMTLGGLAISIGMVVDASIIQVENVQRHLSEQGAPAHRLSTVLNAVLEVRKPSLFGELIIAITFLPIMTLQGMEGKMFAPLAFTISIAIFASLMLSIFVVPVIASFILKPGHEKESVIVKGVKLVYLPALRWVLRRKGITMGIAFAMLAASSALFPFLGTEFIPSLDEGSLSTQIIRLPSVSLDKSVEIELQAQRALMKFPEVQTVVSRIGTAEIAVDPMGPNVSDPYVILKPRDQWKTATTKEELIENIRAELERIPGIGLNITQPIALRVDELISGVKSQIAVKLFGDNMDILKREADVIAKLMSRMRGVADLRVEQVGGQPYLTLEINRAAIARYGINVSDIQEIIETAVGGKTATEVFEEERRFAAVIRFPEHSRKDVESIGNILVSAADGSRVPLAQLATLSLAEGPVQISRENAQRRIVIECNVDGRDIGGFVAEAQQMIRQNVQLPSGYFLTWGGQFENQQRAMNRLMIIVPITIGLIFFLLYSSLNSFRHATLVIMNLPFAVIGGIVALVISGAYLSVPASVGFIALFGVAVLNGVVLVSYFNKLRLEGAELGEAIIQGCELRLRPILMTATVAALGLIPLLLATGPGSEIQRPLATVVIGGLVTSTVMTLLVLPVLYGTFGRGKAEGQVEIQGDTP